MELFTTSGANVKRYVITPELYRKNMKLRACIGHEVRRGVILFRNEKVYMRFEKPKRLNQIETYNGNGWKKTTRQQIERYNSIKQVEMFPEPKPIIKQLELWQE